MKSSRHKLAIHQATLNWLLAVVLLVCAASSASAQNWQLVWSDEFNGSIGPDWSYDTGGGGWGNNEQEFYQSQNATIENNMLAITAKRESVGGANYTSARLKTQGHRSWKYGKIVARIALPGFQGSWPGFWMLGDNIGSVGWPACGEIDIMEQINAEQTVHGSTHWYNNGQADWTSSAGTNIGAFHEYGITWDNQYIRYTIDNNQYAQFYIGGNSGGTNAFNNNNFFIILNLAVGGNWPGGTVNNGALPGKMLVDYVRVYQAGSANPIAGVHSIINVQNGEAVDNASSNGLSAKMILWGSNGGNAQKWNFTQNSDTSWNIVSQYSGMALDNDASSSNGTQLSQYTANSGNNNQHWWVDQQSDGTYKIWNKVNSKSLDNGSKSGNNIPLIQWDWNGGNQQRWRLQ